MHPQLIRLFEELDQFDKPIAVKPLRRMVRGLRISRRDLGSYVRFGKSCYRRNLVHTGPAYQALVLCWRSGQRSPIHDHRGSACAVRVVEGIATETRFAVSPAGLLFPTDSSHATEGSVCASFDMDIHQMGNLQPAGRDLITLHIYSPALLAMGTYFLGNSVLGEDDRAVAMLIRQRVRNKALPQGNFAVPRVHSLPNKRRGCVPTRRASERLLPKRIDAHAR
ncbi:MAG: cysteine dioxygenase family protein [Planctomycetes bacterium]|nr:cysteine dioxygenase family protein [Planctomycetota bacterium]